MERRHRQHRGKEFEGVKDKNLAEQPDRMSSWLSRTASSHPAQLATAAVVSGVVVAGAIFGYQHVRRQEQVEDLKRSIPDIGADHVAEKLTDFGAASPLHIAGKEDERGAALAVRAQQGDYDEDLVLEQLARNRVFLTDDGLKKLRDAFVIVVGCGGVGSHAASALARSGVSKIRLIDFDQVTLSSLNRHAVATLADVGTPKVLCLKKRLHQVTPWVKFDCLNELFSKAVARKQLSSWEGQKPHYVIDAIDNIESKVALLAYCHKNSIPVVSAMGAGCKSDPTRIFIGDVSASTEDPLSRSTRRLLRAEGISTGIPVVYSTEKPGTGKAQLLPLPEEEFAKGSVNELGVLPDFRVRILPVLGTMPAVFGYAVANHVILEVASYPHEYGSGKGREKMYDSILGNLQSLEERLAVAKGYEVVGLKIPISKDDVAYLVEEVFRGRSVISGLTTRLALVRWQALKQNSVDENIKGQIMSRLKLSDLVCVTKEEAAVHEREVLKGHKSSEEVYGEHVMRTVRERASEEAFYARFR